MVQTLAPWEDRRKKITIEDSLCLCDPHPEPRTPQNPERPRTVRKRTNATGPQPSWHEVEKRTRRLRYFLNEWVVMDLDSAYYYGNELEDDDSFPLNGDGVEGYMSLIDLWTFCIKAVLGEWFDITAYVILSSCFLRWVGNFEKIPRWVIHSLSTLLGFYCMVGIMDWHGFYAFTFAVLGITTLYMVDWIFQAWRTFFVTAACLIMIIGIGEYKLFPSQWNRIRGSVMIMAMKLISLAMDIDDGRITRHPPLIPVFGYLFHTATVIFGPWISFYDYFVSVEPQTQSDQKPDLLDPLWLLSLLRTLTLSTMCLVLSSCGLDWLLGDASSYGIWLEAFRDALIFRMSHYFVCFHSESSALAAGVQAQNSANEWNLEIVRPKYIELPRSLVEVVVFWNRPMHVWLKNHVFKRIIPRGRLIAVLGTFAASSVLHGLSFRISAVLFSLGFLTYTEFSLRSKLSTAFNACLGARECRNCHHEHKDTPRVRLVNLFFTLLAIFHLTYLGTMFDSQPEDNNMSSMEYTLNKWRNLGFASHIVALVMFFVDLMV
ncbi:protein-serine O-palmitoleoyltransferase porcupine [Galendromus occidentalis]|uniref:Protein-serine O-palmitoleoyltransferase porcupine n=1 Tax=Galendromus occidentalis TaxID=34638 RepID=A0AAJ7WGV6_9ACAR|nr:protein-serine O-palmitoleoyltransferase porcupine [Galendromus occidentalis]